MSYYEGQPAAPLENVGRGTVVALLAVPAGIIVWVIIWSIGIVASIVSFGVAYLALFLYRLGSGGPVSRAGAVRITIITLGTVVLAIIAGLVSDVAIGIGRVANVSPIEALSSPRFGEVFTTYLTQSGPGLAFSIVLAIVFGIFGCFSILRSAFRATAVTQPDPMAQGSWAALQKPEQTNPFGPASAYPDAQPQQPAAPGFGEQEPPSAPYGQRPPQ